MLATGRQHSGLTACNIIHAGRPTHSTGPTNIAISPSRTHQFTRGMQSQQQKDDDATRQQLTSTVGVGGSADSEYSVLPIDMTGARPESPGKPHIPHDYHQGAAD